MFQATSVEHRIAPGARRPGASFPFAVFFFLLIFLALVPSGPAAAPPGADPAMAFGFKGYGLDQGLTSPSITTMVQDLDGFLWVGTEDGLFRLEGKRFRRFGTEDGLPANNIEALSLGRPRGIWATTSKGIVRWDGRRFLRPGGFGFPGFDNRPGLAVPGGAIILSHFEAKQRFFSSTDEKSFSELKGLPWGGGANCAFFDAGRNFLLVSLQEGLWAWDGKAWKSRVLFDDAEGHKDIRMLLVDRAGRIWIRLTERLYRLESFEAPPVAVTVPEPLSMVNHFFLVEDAFGRVWTNTARNLIWVSESGSGVLGERQGLPPTGAFVLYVDVQGTLWAGGDGVFKLLGDSLWSWATRKEGLPADVVWSICRTRDGRVWAGTGGGLAFGTPEGWRLVPGTGRCQILSLYEDAGGTLWVGHEPGGGRTTGLMSVPPGGTEAWTVPVFGIETRGPFFTMASDSKNSFWISAAEAGLLRAFPGPAGVRVEKFAVPGWIEEPFITKIDPDGAGGIWVSSDQGAAHWNGRDWAVLPKGTLSDQEMMSVLALGSESAWFALSSGKRLVRVRREGDALRLAELLPASHPLSQSLIFALAADPYGVIWAATARGLMRWEGGRVERYGRNAGFPGEDCAQNALWVEPNGDVWAGLSVGLVHGAMNLRREPQTPPGVVLLESKDGQGRLLDDADPGPTVSWPARTMAFRYALRGSRWTEGVGFQVRLVGMEEAWRNTDVSEALFPGLDAGHYRFEVRAVSTTAETGAPESFSFRILAPWWRRWWSQLGGALILAGAVVLAFRRRTAILLRRNEFLESLVQARTSELEKANEALREAVLIDPLTGLYNRRYLTLTMPEEEIRLRRMFRSYLQKGESPLNRNEDLVLFLGDLDFFKRINDEFGHAAGDQVIMETARVLRTASRTADTLVRWGGEEFLLVAKRTDRTKAHLIAEKLCRAVRDHVSVLPGGATTGCKITIGFAAFPILEQNPEAFTWEDALQVADQCLYAVKRAGGDGWAGIHTPGPLDSVEILSRLRMDLAGLVREGFIRVQSSFPEGSIFNGLGAPPKKY